MRYTFAQFREEYPDDDACLDAVFQNRYGDLKACPKCGVIDAKFYRVKKRKCYACAHCGGQLHPLADTIFRKSSTSLWNWFYAIYLFSTCKNGVSAKELERHLGVSYETAWRMARQIRKLMTEDIGKLGGGDVHVEVDETYVGGRRRSSARYTNKEPVFGMVERGGRVKAMHVKSTGSRVLMPHLTTGIVTGSTVYTDEAGVYKKLNQKGYIHDTVKHSLYEYVRIDVYTNTIEGFWSLLKRGFHGTYHSVSKQHLNLYVQEFVYRYNHRQEPIAPVLLAKVGKPFLSND